jgi:3-deoxy-D-manno-octulosonate 8-phosphate phosphatase (KDO 8-P phosphatase)
MKTKPLRQRNKPKTKLLLLDVDGVMTDGGVYYSNSGDELKKFNIHDGLGIVKLQRSGVKVGIITGKVSRIVERRAADLGIEEVHQNLEDKLEVYEQIKQRLGLRDEEIAYIGDDEPDLAVLRKVGLSACPADAVASVKKSVGHVLKQNGGFGAVREVVEMILKKNGRG